MEACERETIITINDQDLKEGFFWIGTTKRNHAERIKKKLSSHIMDVKTEEYCGTIVSWTFKIPAVCITKHFGLKTPRVISDEQKEAMRARGRHLSKTYIQKA